ncbi:NifB/NifX family molybdenum-iron cluster-binding protein [Sulfurovum sp.]|uniref:NifB/NifX family molybdenum-iron cluster-binding protein n=1 Tax=Sulfurovum sp. TaxID=1969726 RepID=UPI0025D1C74F|nr:NifB/NifX family molybdenum-iron cluster-binding protein [Sulfurovum sp.]
MKIVFTAQGEGWESPMDPRFGRAKMFLVYDEATDRLEAIDNSETDSMDHGVGNQASKKMITVGADIVITGNGAGEKALKILKTTQIAFYTGAGDMSVKEAYRAYKKNRLQKQY